MPGDVRLRRDEDACRVKERISFKGGAPRSGPPERSGGDHRYGPIVMSRKRKSRPYGRLKPQWTNDQGIYVAPIKSR